MARGKGKYGPKSKILVVLKSAHQKFLENALFKLIFSKVKTGHPRILEKPRNFKLFLRFFENSSKILFEGDPQKSSIFEVRVRVPLMRMREKF